VSAKDWPKVALIRPSRNSETECVAVRRFDDRWVCRHGEDTAESVRPLVVIDLEDGSSARRLTDLFYEAQGGDRDPHHYGRMQQALREFANPTPPKPEEPTGLGAVVEDAEGAIWIHVYAEECRLWAKGGEVSLLGHWRSYADINAVRVLSEGVTDA